MQIARDDSQLETWLSGSTAEAFALARSFDPVLMRISQNGGDKEDLLGQTHAVEQPPLL